MTWPVKRDEFGCELWLGELSKDGYGLLDRRMAHRVRWEKDVGPIPADKVLDHLCRRRRCVAIHHLELVSPSDNERRKLWRHRLRPYCRVGHDLRLMAIVTPEGGRICRACNREASRTTLL
jgi:hypothetical protein